jgi:Tfp pilus assembly protein PilN
MAQHLNLLVAELLPQRRRWTLAQGLAGLALLGVGGLLCGGVLDYLASRMRIEVDLQQQAGDALRLQLAGLQARDGADGASARIDAELTALRRQAGAIDQARQLISSGAAGQPGGHASLLLALARQSDPAVWLTGLQVSADHTSLELRGRMLDPAALPGYLAHLQVEPLLHGRRFAQLGLRRVDAGTDGQAGTSGPIEFTLRSASDAAPALPRPGGAALP